ncbi:MAG: discoidin domain-containing protein [Bacteroidaceae bacterium]|nr:discoidin domain-containing protein [Bacteroidaceae bacterium]
MRNIFTRLWVVSLLLLTTATVSAQLTSLEVGQVYRFVSARADRSLSADGVDDVHTKTTDAADTKQEWYVTKEGDYYVLRNLACGKYLKGAYSANTPWSMTDDYSDEYNKFELHTSNSTLNTLKTKSSDGYGYMHDDNNGDNGGYNIVGWLNGDGNTGTRWTITKVDYTTEQITALLEKAPTTAELEGYATALGELFSDAACVTPKLASLSAAKSNAAYSDLPTALQAMVDKVYNEKAGTIEAWAEDNADDAKGDWSGEYAKKFRVQMYEPYSIAGDITSWLGINAHANNDNPTGIHMPEAGTLYVMVEGTIKDGASLRIVDGGHNSRVTNATSGGYTLKPGLNVIIYTGTAGQLYICYNVDTYNPDGATTAEKFPHKLSEYPPLKIHIEGGAITGYYNACGDFRAADSGTEDLWKTITGASVDNDADWVYMETRANLNVIPLLAHRQILLFHLNDYTHEDGGTSRGMAYYLPDQLDVPTTPYNSTKNWADYGMECDPSTGKINIMLEAWDRIMYSELATMGLVSQSTMAQMNAFYPRWESDYTTKYEMYDYTKKSPIDNKTYQEFCNGLDYSEYFNHHGVALGTESGYMYGGWDHCGYSITTYDGIVRNMANSAGSTWGPAHEIGHQHQAPLTLNGLTEVTNNLFSNIALWYKGMSTSRYNGDNGSLESVLNAYNTEGSDIYTNNIWALTHLYYRLWLYYHLAGNNTQFWPRLYELLRQQPMQKGYNVSGDVSTLHFYKLACQAAGEDLTEFFRAHGYFSIMDNRLVGDYSNSVYEVSQEMIDEAIAEVKEMGYEENLAIIFICDDDENATYVQHDGVSTREIYGETTPDSDFGSVSDFINGNVSVETTYTATLNSDGTLTMSGGEGGVGFLVLNEDGEIVSFSNKSTFAISDEAAYLLATGKASVVTVDTESTTTEAEVDVTAMRFALLQELIENAIALTQNTSATRVGFYKSSAVENLQGYVEMAQEVIANGDLANLQAVYELLYNEYNAVVANEFSRVTFVPGSKYAIISVKSNDRILTYSGSNVTTVSGNADAYSSTDAYQWYIERDGAYYIKNAGTSKYIQDVTDQNGVLYTVGDNKVNMNINEVALGCYTIATSNVPGRYMNMDGANAARIITWGDAYSENSQWAFILLEADDTNRAKEELLELSKKTLALVNEVATVSYNEGSKISLQSSSSTAANYIWSNAAVSGNDVDKLIDGNKDSFFHSQWNNSTAPADGWGHHISVDLGTSSTLTSFKFKFTTRNASGLSNYPKTIEVYGSDDNSTYTKLQVASGFATGAGVDNEAVVMGNGTAYRYLRFLVTDATGNNSGTNTGSDDMVFFHMSEFSIYPVTVSATVKSDYTSGVTVDAVLAAYNDAEQGKTVYNNASATLADINAKKTALGDGTAAGSYTTLLNEYNSVLNSVLNAKKAQLLTLITNTNNLIKTVGSVEFTDVPLALTTENLYCNDPCLRNDTDYSADYVSKLTDGVHSTFMHTDWDDSNSAGSAPHYLRVDMGEGETITQFKFSYTTRDNGNNCPTIIVVEGSNDAGGNGTYTTITTLTKDANSLPVEYDTFNSETIISTVPYRYIRFKVTATESGDSFFVMSEFSFTKANQPVVTMTNTSTKADEALVFDTYLAITKSQKLHNDATTVALLDAAIADLQVAYDKLDEAIKTPAAIDKSVLQALYNEVSPYYTTVQELYASMADENGAVNENYSPSSLTNEQLATAKTALDNVQTELLAAQTALSDATSQDDINAAKEALNIAYDALKVQENDLLAIKNENVNLQETFDKSNLNTLINSTNTLLAAINSKADDYYAPTALALDELNEAFASAQDVATRYYITEEQYTTACDELNTRYTAINNVVAADVADRAILTEAIDKVNTLLTDIATTREPEKLALPLQVTNAENSFYIWSNAPADDDNGIGALLDNNTGTFFGTNWRNGEVDPYTHYLEVDLGAATYINKLSMDYTTRESGYENQRPTAIKILGSNNKVDYTLIKTIEEGLATGACEQWAMENPLELGAPFRYIRFAVATQKGYFNMADFNLYVIPEHTFVLKEYYTTAKGIGLEELCIALQSAQYAAEHYITSDRLTMVVNMLNKYYDVTNGVVEDDYTTRDGLTTLITDTEALINKVATVTEVATPELSTANVYCNADNSTHGSANAADKLGVAALFDGDISTHLHTTYGGNAQDDDLDHYIRVDMGENNPVAAFKFSYKGRKNNTNNSPTAITVQAANDVDGNWNDIISLSDMVIVEGQTATYQSPYIEMNEPYRYVRIMVTDTYNHDYTTYNGTTHKFFVLSEFDFVSYPIVEVNADYPNVVAELVTDAYNEKGNATEATGYYMTENEYNTTLNELQAAYDALKTASQADKTALKKLIEDTGILKNELYEMAYDASEVALSATEGDAGYLYCNAVEKHSTWTNDHLGVPALLDEDASNWLHTMYSNYDSEDGLDHYLRVDLGAGVAANYIEFKYNARNENLAPSIIVVQACNSLDADSWTDIATLKGLSATTDEVASGCLGNGTEYRYWRFMVTATNKGDLSMGHPYFALTNFEMYTCTNVEIGEQLKYTPTIYIYTTTELVTEVENAITAATDVDNNVNATQTIVDAEVEALQAVYDKLEEALKYADVPVAITTDEENPVLYKIFIKRTADVTVLKYDETTKQVAVVNTADNSSWQAWYFTGSENGVRIHPFNADGKVLAADNTSNAAATVWAAAKGEKNFDEWKFVSRADGYYNIQAHDGSNYFSNNGGTTKNMGFWKSDPSTDTGSLFKFVEAEFDNDNARYYQLSDVKATMIDGTNIYGGTSVGLYTGGKEYREAYTAAGAIVTAGNTGDATECHNAYKALREAKENLSYNAPDAEKVYYIKSAATGENTEYCQGTYVYSPNKSVTRSRGNYTGTHNHTHLLFDTMSEIGTKAHAAFQFVATDTQGSYKIKNLHTGLYVQAFTGTHMSTEAGDAAIVKIAGFADGQVTLKIGDNSPMHAQRDYGVIVQWGAEAGNASLWTINEITEIEDLTYTTTMSQLGYGTLMLGYDVNVPEGITANVATKVDGKYIIFEEVGGVIPANTAVILKSKEELTEALTLNFEYAGNNAVALEDNMLGGSLYDTTIDGVNNKVYQMQANNGTVKFYWMYAEYNQAGELTNAGTDDGGYVKLPANKAYFSMPKSEGASSYSFRFPWDGTTDIEGIVTEDNDALNGTIFDLQGRKIVEIAEPGFYIINGKKVFVEEIK